MEAMLAHQPFERKKRLTGGHLDAQPRRFPWRARFQL
jgi:hypothetical protein